MYRTSAANRTVFLLASAAALALTLLAAGCSSFEEPRPSAVAPGGTAPSGSRSTKPRWKRSSAIHTTTDPKMWAPTSQGGTPIAYWV